MYERGITMLKIATLQSAKFKVQPKPIPPAVKTIIIGSKGGNNFHFQSDVSKDPLTERYAELSKQTDGKWWIKTLGITKIFVRGDLLINTTPIAVSNENDVDNSGDPITIKRITFKLVQEDAQTQQA